MAHHHCMWVDVEADDSKYVFASGDMLKLPASQNHWGEMKTRQLQEEMHPYLFFYFLGGVTFIPVTLIVTLAVLWIRMPKLDPSKPRPTDMPPPHVIQEQTEKILENNTNANTSISSGVEKGGAVRRRKSTAKLRSKTDQQLSTNHGTSTSISNTTASAPTLRKTSQSGSDHYDAEGASGSEDDDDLEKEGKAPKTLGARAVPAREPDVPMQSDPNLNREGYVRMTRVPRLGPAAESISDYMTNMLFQPKNARPKDSYYAVLRYDTLFLYESDQQRDCKAVVPMTLYEVRIFPKTLPDNEVFNKEHPIQIKRKADAPASTNAVDNGQDEYYIFIHTPVIKEDWYLALLYASKLRKPGTKQKIQDKAQFDPEAIQNHIRILHSDKHHEHTRWFNSFLGRIFLGVYKTKKIQDVFIQKITRKTLKLKRPSFLGEIKVKSFNVGHSIPYITRTKLHELALNGELTAEFHLAYRGGIRVEIEVDVGLGLSSLKPVKVTIVLAVLVKAISGMMTLKIKAPPTNRFWIGFQEPPEMDIVIEPIVADKAIKLNMVLSAIESKIREAMQEAIVLPNMDDYPFFDSHGTGGIFEGDEEISPEATDESDAESTMAGKAGKSAGSKSAGGRRRGSESSFSSEHAPPPPTLLTERKPSWSSAGTDSDVDPESVPIASTPPIASVYINHQNNNSSSNTSNLSTSSIASKFKRFSQAHFSSKSSDSLLVDSAKLNTKPTVATSIATAIRTSPSAAPHSGGSINGSNSSKLQAVIPKLSSALNDSTESHAPRIFTSSPANGPAKKTSTSSLRRLASLESPETDVAEESDGADDTISPTGNDPLYQSLRSPVESNIDKSSQDGARRTDSDTYPQSAGTRKWDTVPANANGVNGRGSLSPDDAMGRGSLSSSSSHVGIAGILEGNNRAGSISQVQGNLANLFSLDKKNKKPQVRDEMSDSKVDGEVDNNSSMNGKDRGRKNSGDALLHFKQKKDTLLKKITSRGNEEDQEGGGKDSDSSSLKGSSTKFSLDSVGTLLGHRKRGSVSSNSKGSPSPSTQRQPQMKEMQDAPQTYRQPDQQPLQQGEVQELPRRTLVRSASNTGGGAGQLGGRKEVDLYPLGRPFESASPTSPDPSSSQLPPAPPSTTTPSISPSMSSTSSSSSSSSSSRSAFLQQKSQAALGSAKAWVKRSLEDRRLSDDDPLLSGKMRMD
ncbi:hypothetical protein BGZ58_007541 [Dissophora ornata]|nr:hypothetical protein BGZ58_007541 [Dissophora ornata]